MVLEQIYDKKNKMKVMNKNLWLLEQIYGCRNKIYGYWNKIYGCRNKFKVIRTNLWLGTNIWLWEQIYYCGKKSMVVRKNLLMPIQEHGNKNK
jgi:hypothetical protein